MKTPRVDVGSIRRQQIVEAAAAIISEQGIQNLSLSEIEKKAGMSRGQLTYYFKSKEDILLAVFDRLLQRMHERAQTGEFHNCTAAESGWERVKFLLSHILLRPPAFPEFGALQYTFLSQISHREDFRQRLANLYEQWRSHMAGDLAAETDHRPANKKSSPRALATLVQAVIHGLFIQRAADPDAFDQKEVVELLFDLLESYLRPRGRPTGRTAPINGAPAAPQKADL
jgi:AcrR family transcriptional regulator